MLLENIFVQIPAHILWKDTESSYLGCNQAMASWVGLNANQEIIGKTDYDLCWYEYADIYQQGDQAVLSNDNPYPRNERISNPNGENINIYVNKKILCNDQSQIIGVIGIYHEILDENYYGKFDPKKNNVALTKRQLDCLLLLVKGMTAKQIGDHLGLSRRTVEHHIESLKLKLNSFSKSSLIKKALTLDYIRKKIIY